ncbi:Uncharacterized protein Rs2_01320 [Raphanus sativus]|nr:Uncharacterized protein Rs2_01320 [Raphanus sativus]
MAEADQGNIANQENLGMDVVEHQVDHEPFVDPTLGDHQGSHMALLGMVCYRAPMDVVREDHGMQVDQQRMGRKRKFSNCFSEEEEVGEAVMTKDKGIVASGEGDDHVILEMEERWSSEFSFGQYGSFLLNAQDGDWSNELGANRAKAIHSVGMSESIEAQLMGSILVKKTRGGQDEGLYRV